MTTQTTTHGWTTHGHPCCQQPGPPVGDRPDALARCGGAAICTECATDAARIHAAAADSPMTTEPTTVADEIDPIVRAAAEAAGEIDRALTAIAAVGADRLTMTVRTALVRQLELIAMHRGFPYVEAAEVAENLERAIPAMPEWSTITFSRERP